MNTSSLHRRRGFSLVENMVALAILGIFISGVLASVGFSRRVAETTIYEVAAMNAAQAYLEQIKSMEYNDVLTSSQNPTTEPLATIHPSYSSITQTSIIDDPLYIGSTNYRDIVIDVLEDDETYSKLIMPMEFDITVNDLNSGSSPTEALEVIIQYRYETPSSYSGTQLDGQVQIIKAKVPTF